MKSIRTFLVILAAVIISSCGYNRIRYTKALTTPTEERSPIGKNQVNSTRLADGLNTPQPLTETIRVEENSVQESNELESDILVVERLRATEQLSDTLEAADDIPADVVYRAQKAERNATSSVIFFILGTVGVFFIAFFAFILSGIGLWLYIRSNRSRFITERGEKQLRRAKIALIVNLAVILLVTVAIVALIFLI